MGGQPNWHLGPTPNPAIGPVTIGYRMAAAGSAAIEIFDSAGRLVRRIEAGTHLAGRYSVTWDGRDDAGRTVPAGLYLTRVEAGGAVMGARVVIGVR